MPSRLLAKQHNVVHDHPPDGFFGENWTFINYSDPVLFAAVMIFMVISTVGTAWYVKRKGWL